MVIIPVMGKSCIFRRGFALVAVLVGLTACGYAEWPPRDEAPRDTNRAPSGNAGSAAFTNATAVVVGKGDSVYALSRRHRVPMRAIIEANGLKAPFTLRVGQRIMLPRGPVHVVRKGDTLLAIGNRYNVDPYEVARINGVKPPYVIRIGEPLTLPVEGGGRIKTIAISPNVDADLDGGPGVSIIPDPAPTVSEAGAPGPPKTLAEVTVPRRPSRTNRRPATPPAWSSPPKVARAPDTRNTPSPPVRVPAPPPKSASGFAWPVKGRVISRFGVKAKGLRNDGINIAAARGTPVRAAENGVVAYAGNELRGFGNLLLIKHSGGWVTAYAHNDKVLVKRGQKIRKGDTVATVGSSGSVTRPQLHFEIRKGKKARDPGKLLKGRA